MNRKLGVQIVTLLTIFLFMFTVFSYSVYSVPPITQDVIVVDINGNGDYTSIKEAIENANNTDIIMVMKGVYNEYELNIGKKIEIIGEDLIYTIINCSGNRGFSLSSSYVEISNIQIINVRDYAIATSSNGVGCTFTNCIIHVLDNGDGIELPSSYNMVSGCDIYGYNKNEQGVIIKGSFNIIKNCNINSFGNGVLILLDSSNNNILNCNLFNNEVAIDIRLNSNNNFITNCNIYSNLHSMRLWQNSNNNLVYLNNFWKNDKTASDEENNSWDNGAKGNYWDTYQGSDYNDDGVGDTPFKLLGAVDRYPLMEMILPEEITVPTSIKHISSKSDNTPTFTWSPSVYTKGIKGYYVKIDSNEEAFIGYTTTWTSTEAISDGVHKFYVRGEGVDGILSEYATLTFSMDTSFVDTDGDGWSDEEERQYGTDLEDPDHFPLDLDGDRIPNAVDTDDDNDGYSDSMESSYGTSTIAANIHPTDTDNDGIPDDDSTDGKYTGDVDDDDDYLIDTIEKQIGSNPLNGSDAIRIYISGKPYYLVDTSQEGVFDILYEQTGDTTTAVEKTNGNYLIDEDGDNTWDYVYNSVDGSVSTYKEEQLKLTLPVLILLIMVIILIISLFFLFYYYLKNKSMRIESFGKPEKIVKKPTRIEVKDKIEMISQTKDLLGCIQEDVKLYMAKLYELEDKLSEESLQKEDEKGDLESTKKDKDESDDIADFEADVEEFLSEEDKITEPLLEEEKEDLESDSDSIEETDESETVDEDEAVVEELLSKEDKVVADSSTTEEEETEFISTEKDEDELDTITDIEADVDDILSKLQEKNKKKKL